ncbi:MAG: ribokinase [Alphaproteobacteria bacterium]|jgi:ribokinase|nr:ribokinase [Alphaproteobacteria bacterium]
MILVFGSLNMDLVLAAAAIPRPGETVIGDGYATLPGGKGNNQAVAAARAGAAVAMAGAVGDDAFGRALIDNLTAEGIDTALVAATDRPTGIAMITVDPAGENAISVAAGANRAVAAEAVPDRALTPETTVLMQMEVRAEENWALIRRARAAGARTVLNVAPAAPVPAEALADLDVLVVNQHEAEAVAAERGLDAGGGPAATAKVLADRTDLICVVTLGGDGAVAATADGVWQVAALPVTPIDTTGAGDTFTGVLAAGLDAGLDLPEALRRASVGAALACRGAGAQAAMPRQADIDAAIDGVPTPRPIG